MNITIFLPQQETAKSKALVLSHRRWLKVGGFSWTERVVQHKALPGIDLSCDKTHVRIPFGDLNRLDQEIEAFYFRELESKKSGIRMGPRVKKEEDLWRS